MNPPAPAGHRWRRGGPLAAATAAVLSLLLGGCATAPTPAGDAGAQPAVAAGGPAMMQAPLPEAATPAAPATLPPAPAPETAAPPPDPVPRARLDPEQDAERGDLWERLRSGFGMADIDTELVRKWEQFYASQPDYVQRMAGRGARYLFHIIEEIDKRGLPTELALLPFIESAFNPQAMSTARASGMWQFMPATGKDFELRQNLFRDDRRDVLASTRAALDYLTQLQTQFGNWHLALAAYNWGQGNVQRAIDRQRRVGQDADYAGLRMPDETRNYVPKLQAMKNIIARPEAFGLALPTVDNHPYFLSVRIERDIDVALAARLAGLTLEEFQQLNPQLNKPVILAAGTPRVLLPYDSANRFLRDLQQVQGPLASWTAWVAPRTLKPAEAARLVGMAENDLRDVNRIPPRMLVRAGSTLLVPRPAASTTDVDSHIADHGAMALAPEPRPLRRVAFKTGRRGDTVAAVARRFGVSAAEVAGWNKLSPQASIPAGRTVVVLLPPGAAPAAAAVPKRQVASASAKPARKAAAPRAVAAKPAARVRVAEVPTTRR